MDLNFRRVELLYPYYTAKEMTFADRIGLRDQKCFLQERVEGKFAVITLYEGNFYCGDKIAIRKTLAEPEISPDVIKFLRLGSNSNLFLFGFFEGSIMNFKAFAYFSRASRKIGFNKLSSSSFQIKSCFSGKLENCYEYIAEKEGQYHIFFPLQELLFSI